MKILKQERNNMKYYFFSAAQYYSPPHMAIISYACKGIHPFEKMKWINDNSNYQYSLISFQEISKKEYDLFESLEWGTDRPWTNNK